MRQRRFFDYPATPAILFEDHDPDPEHPRQTLESLRDTLAGVCPRLIDAGFLFRPSSGSYVSDGRSKRSTGLRGIHGYQAVVNGTDIPRAGGVLFDRLCLAGHGWLSITKAGQVVKRGVIDQAVYQPERLDFNRASCKPPLKQEFPPSLLQDGALLDTRHALPDLSEEELKKLTAMRKDMRAGLASQIREARERYVAEHAPKLAARRKISVEHATEMLQQAVDGLTLLSDFDLKLASGTYVSVAQLLDNPKLYHNTRCADPLEPDYRGDSRIAWINLFSGGTPYIFTHAHGGMRYTLSRARRAIHIVKGERPRNTDELIELLNLEKGFFDYGHRQQTND